MGPGTYNEKAGGESRLRCYAPLVLSRIASVPEFAAALPRVAAPDLSDEFAEAHKILWQERENVELVARTIRRALTEHRGPSFYAAYGRDA